MQNTKYQWFQYRINQNILATNRILYKMKIVESPICTFCKDKEESLVHVLWECEKVQELIQEFESWVDSKSVSLNFNKKSFLLGLTSNTLTNLVYNNILILIKFYIYKTRCENGNLAIVSLKSFLLKEYEVQKFIQTKNGKFNEFINSWRCVLNLFTT
jgi:hypothetical protein